VAGSAEARSLPQEVEAGAGERGQGNWVLRVQPRWEEAAHAEDCASIIRSVWIVKP
jgi:hypothetical protein